MADYDDKKFGPLFPKRIGGSDGSRERVMLDAVGGADSFRTRYRTNADGSVTRLRTKSGMPEFVTTKAVEEEPPPTIRPSFTFYAVPASASHLNGYVPPDSLGAACRWDKSGSGIPSPHGSTSPNGTLASFAPTGASGEAPFGAMTWYSDKVVLNGKRVVVSWRGPNVRSGRWGSISGSVVSKESVEKYSYLPSNSPAVSLNPDIVPLDGGKRFGKDVWIGGPEIKVTVNVHVWCAGIREAAPGQYELVVVSSSSIYAAPITLFSTADGRTVINPALNGLVINFSGVEAWNPDYSTTASLHWTQTPFLNASCTKFVTIIERTYPTPIRSGVVEFDVATAEATWVFDNYFEDEERIVRGSGSGSWVWSYAPGAVPTDLNAAWASSAATRTKSVYHASAADYIEDKLVFIGIKSTDHSGGLSTGATLSGSQTTCVVPFYGIGGGDTVIESRSQSVTITDDPGSTGVTILHSLEGVVGDHVPFAPTSGVATKYDNSSLSPTPTANTPYTMAWASGGSVSRQFVTVTPLAVDHLFPEMMVVNADLRHGFYVIHSRLEVSETQYVGEASGAWEKSVPVYATGAPPYWAYDMSKPVTGSGSSSGTSSSTSDHKVRCSVFANNQEVWFGEIEVAPASSSAVSSPLAYDYIYAVGNPASGVVKTVTDGRAGGLGPGPDGYVEVLPSTRLTDNGYYFPWPMEKIPAYCHVAVSDDGKAAYIDLKTAEYGPSNISLRKAFFLLDGVVHDVPDGYYAPGAFSTLCSPIFYPRKP